MSAARRLIVLTLVACCAAVGAVAFLSASALAAGPPVVVGESEAVTEVAADSATFQAQVSPEGEATSYRFEYGTTEAYGASVPVPEGIVGSGTSAITVQAHVQGLLSHTTYHYRVVAHSALGTVTGGDRAFVTQTVGGALSLPDGRQWELVSPPDKQGALIETLGENSFEGNLIQASADGDAIAYLASAPTEAEPQGYGKAVTVLSTRDAGGWSSQVITPAHAKTSGEFSLNEYLFFSEDLSRALLQPAGGFTALSPEANESTPYLRTDYLGGNVEEHCRSACFQPLVTSSDTLAGAVFGEEPNGECEKEPNLCGPAVEAASPDLSHIVFYSGVQLTSAPGGGLYEWSSGRLRLVGGGTYTEILAGSGTRENVRNDVADNGNVIMEGPSLWDAATGETIQLAEPEAGGTGGGGGIYMDANRDASRVFFLDSPGLTEESLLGVSAGGEDLYEYNLDAPLGSRLTDLTVDRNAGEAANVQMVVGTSEDGSYVYFAAGGVLAEGAAPGVCPEPSYAREFPGRVCNLYVSHDGITRLVASLPSEDVNDWVKELGNQDLLARVSPNGHWLAFMSAASLTGYDTRDAVSGHPDMEVYLYDADSGKLVCASCDPTGARPTGVLYKPSIENIDIPNELYGEEPWVAANIPGWMEMHNLDVARQSRYLSDSGRLFFDSSDALVSQDVNGTEDVYEYEPPGVGDCTTASGTYSERSDGCVGLISSGTSPEDSAFLEASETGGDVFFVTTARLVPQDVDDAYDAYDAHECMAAAPCFAEPAAVAPPCATEASCRPAPTPQPAIFGVPASATFSGSGNVVSPGSPPVVRSKSLTRAQKLTQALDACKRKGRKQRAVCERRARRLYRLAGKSAEASAERSRG